MVNIVPDSARSVLDRALDNIRIRANSNGECFGGEIMDALREAGTSLGIDRLEILLIRTVLVQTMESMAEVLQNYDHRMPVSEALKYLREAIEWTARLKDSAGTLPASGRI